MKRIITQTIVLIALAIGTTTSAQSQADTQDSMANIRITYRSHKNGYLNSMRFFDNGRYVIAYALLHEYRSRDPYFGVFDKNPQFRQQVEDALREIEAYYRQAEQAVVELENVRRQLQECRQSAKASKFATKITGLKVTKKRPGSQLPRVHPRQR